MPIPTLEELQVDMPAHLPEAVRQDQRSPTFEITHWEVAPLSEHGIINPKGLFQFSGRGRDGNSERVWTVVLKASPEPGADLAPSNMWYDKREVYAMQSSLLAQLPHDALCAPRCYGVEERGDCNWIWMEYIFDVSPKVWTIDQYVTAARYIGRFNGAVAQWPAQPDESWLSWTSHRDWTFVTPDEGWVWENDYVRRFVSADMRERIERLWTERERFYSVIETLPRSFVHFDVHRRNLMFRRRPDGGEDLVAVDWAQCGLGPLGADLHFLVCSSAILRDLAAADVPAVDAAAFDAFLVGLRDAGWDGDPSHVRLVYDVYAAIWTGMTSVPFLALWTGRNVERIQQAFGCTAEEFAEHIVTFCTYALDRADEARRFMDRLL
jgi:hypothetical protein